jgi:hypothetical protein
MIVYKGNLRYLNQISYWTGQKNNLGFQYFNIFETYLEGYILIRNNMKQLLIEKAHS